MGYTVAMAEVSRDARDHAAAQGIVVYTPAELAALAPGEMDVVMAWDTLEHIYDLPAVITEIWRLLKPGGVFLFNVPSTGSKSARLFGRLWWAYREPEHVVYLTTRSIWLLLRGQFDIQRTWHDPQNMTLGGAALRFGRLMPRWLAPTMGKLSFKALQVLELATRSIPIPHGNRMYVAIKDGAYARLWPGGHENGAR